MLLMLEFCWHFRVINLLEDDLDAIANEVFSSNPSARIDVSTSAGELIARITKADLG